MSASRRTRITAGRSVRSASWAQVLGAAHVRSARSEPSTGGDRGSVTLFVAIAAMGLLVLVGLVVDGGAKVRAVQRADRLAAEAARAAGQAIDLTAVMSGREVRVEPREALGAARAYLAAAGNGGTAQLDAEHRSIQVTTTASSGTVFLGLIGISEFTVHGSATVSLIRPGRDTPP